MMLLVTPPIQLLMTDDGRHIAAMFELSAGEQQLLPIHWLCTV
jgi:hypothetical protein